LSLILASGIVRFEFYKYFGCDPEHPEGAIEPRENASSSKGGRCVFEHPFSLSADEDTFGVRAFG
jgi:hypothetical protein